MMTPDEILRQADEQIAARKKQESAPQAAMQASEVKQEPRYLSETDMGFDAPARGLKGWGQDIAATAVKSAIAVPELAVGLMDIPTGGRVGKFLENKDGAFGFRPKEAKEAVNEWHSDATKQAQQKFQQADGLVDKFGVALENPSLVATAVGESIPSMMAGGVVARGFLGAAKAGAFGNAAAKAADTTKGAVLAGAAGEGATMAGAQASAIRQETEDGLLTPGQSGAALATGVIGAAISFGGGKLADRLGVGNVDTMLAQGKQGMAKEFADSAAGAATNPAQAVAAAKSLPRQVIEGAIVEGAFEELPQSVTETVIQNLALNKPWAEGLDDAIVLGILSGGAMGAGAAGYKGLVTPRGAGQQQPGQAPDGGAPADVAADPGAPAGAAAGGSISAASQAQEPAQVSPLFDNATAPEPFVNQSAMEAAGFAPRPPEPVLDTQRLDRALAPQKPSEAMGLRTGPDAGPLENAAALSVDTGATAKMQQAAVLAEAAEAAKKAKPETQKQERQAKAQQQDIDQETGEILSKPALTEWSDTDLSTAFRNAQAKDVRLQLANELSRRRAAREEDALQAELRDEQAAESMPDVPDSAFARTQEDAGPVPKNIEILGDQAQPMTPGANAEGANVATLAQLNRKKLAEMSDDELQQLSSMLPADHSRQQKIKKAIQTRAEKAQAAINEGAKADGTQTDQAQQAQPQQPAPRTAAGQAIDSAPTAAGAQAPQAAPITSNVAPNAGVEQAQAAPAAVVAAPEPRAQRVAQAGQQWAGMTTAQRQEAAARANGIKPVIAKNLPKAEWGKLNADVQGKLADAMGTTPAQDSGVNEPENQFQSEPEWWTGRSEDERRLLISVTNRLSGNAFANATTEWDSLSSEQKTFLAKEYDKYASGGASVEPKAIAKLIARNDGKSSAPKPKQTSPRTQQEPEIKKSDAKALFSGKAMDRTRKAVPADARAMEQFIADGKEAEFQRLLSIRQTGRDNLTDEETNQFYDLRTERNQAKAAVENAGYYRVKPNQPPARTAEQRRDDAVQTLQETRNSIDALLAMHGDGLDPADDVIEVIQRAASGFDAPEKKKLNRFIKEFTKPGKNGTYITNERQFFDLLPEQFGYSQWLLGDAINDLANEAQNQPQAQAQKAQAATESAAKPANLFSDPRTGAPVVVPNKATADAMARSKQLSGKVAVRKATPAEMADERNAFTGYNAGENRRIGYVLEMLPPQDAQPNQPPAQSQQAPAAAEPVAQPITRADVEAAKQQAAAIIGARIDAMSAGDVNKIAKKFLPTMGMKPTMSKANNKAAMTDPGINLEAAAAEVGATLPAEVTRALQADMEGRVVDVAQRPTPQASAVAGAETAKQNAVGADDFPMNEAQGSYSGISHSGRARALGDKEAFDAFMQKAQKDVEAAQTDAQRTAAQEALQSLRADYLSAYRSLMNVRAGTYSGYVAGRGNINSKQANARNNALDKAMSRFDDWRADNADRVKRAIRDARTPEQVQQDQAALAKSIKDKAAKVRSGEKDFVRKVLGWKKGDETSVGRAGFLVGVNFDRDGYPSTLKMKAADGAKLLDDKFDLAALLRKSGESVSDAKRKVRELVDEVRAEASDGDTQSAPAAPASKTPAIDAQDVVFSQNLLSPAASGSKPAPEQIQQLVDKVQQLAKGGFLVRVTGSPVNVPGVKVPAGAKPTGAVIDGNIYLFTDNLSSIGDAYVTMFHEIFHLGLQKVLPAEDYAAVLKQFASNPLVAKFVRQWEASAEGIEKAAKMPSAAYEALATEEALAMIAEELSVNDGEGTRNMPGLAKKMLSWFAQVADKLGFPPNFSNWVRNLTRTDAERFVNDMTRAVLGGSKNLAKTKAKYGSMAAQMTAQDRLRAPDGVDQTQTEAFKRWFGDSKVVDADGKPLVMYHGTGADFSVFDDKKRGSHTREVDARQGFFLTSSPEIANEYAEEAGANGGANIMPAYVSLQNPLVIDEGGRDYDAERFRDYIDQAQEQGHDGVLLRNTGDGMFKNGRTGDTVIAFRSEQIKSAIGNNGQFDPANPDIRYSRMDDNAATEGVSNEQRQTPNGIPAGLPATSDPDSQYLERRINNWLQTSGWRADRLSAVSLPIELRTALDRFTDATGTRVVLFRNLTPEIEDFNGVNFRDGRVFINETSQHPATLTAAHEWVHNFKRTNPKLYQQLEDEVREQGRIPQWHQRNIKEEGMDRGIDHAIEELTAAAVSDAMTDPAFLEQLALRNQGVFRRVAQAFLDFLDTLTSGWRDQGSNAYLRDVQAFRNKLADVLDRLPTIGQDAANFAANPARRPGSAQDKAVMSAIAQGKSTRDVLRLVANGSKDPFLRQVARLLLKAGITPNIQFGHIGKTKKGNPIYGQYRGKSDTIAIAGSAEYAAERIFMHEAMHAATMRALAKPGLPRLQLQKLLEHVRKHGGAAGFYGLKNVDEFVAEVFTNPDFQAALRKMNAPSGSSGIKTAWDGFVRILRSILGLKNDPNNALSQALELGVAAVREDMVLRKRADRASLRLRGDVVAAAGVTPLQLRVQTVEWAKQRWSEGGGGQAEVVRNTDPRFGKDVRIAWQGVKHAIAGANQPELRLIPHVAKIMQSAQYLRSEDDRANRAHIKKAHFFEANVVLDGERLLVGMVVHEKADGQMFYDQFIVSKARDQKDAPPHGTSGNGMPGISDRSVLQPSSGGGSIVGQGMDSGQDGVANFGVDDIARIKASAIDRVHQTMTHPGKMSLWDKTVGTMRHIAERYPAFKPVYDAAQQFIDDVASLANTAANVAPRLIPRVDSLRDMLKKPISVDDNKAIAKALFEGTLDWGRDQHGKAMPMDELRAKYAGLNVHQKAEVLLAAGKVPPQVMAMWRGQKIEQFETLIHNKFESAILKPGAEFSEKELKEFFNLNGEQISLYKEARATVAKSLDITARAEMMRRLGHDFDHLRAMVLDAPSLADAWKLLDDELESRAREIPDSRDLMADKMFQLRATVDRVRDLLEHGYMPLSRFGKYTLEVIDQDGERVYFGLFESQADSNRMALQMRNVYKGAKVTQGTMNEEKYKLFAGITPETAELFGNMLGLDEEGQDAKSKAFQEYLRMAKNNHSALKRLIHRKGTAGYSEDVGRVLASFVYSNARLAATGLNAGRMEGAIHRLNTEHKEQGELGKIAMQLREYIQDPQEEGLWLRGMLFAQYLGGSIASALVNTTQPFAVTIPWLSQYGGMAKASAYMAKAVQDMGKRAMNKGSTTYEADLAAALKQAEDDGVVSPQEIHQLMAQARGAGGLRTGDGTKLGNARAQASNYWEKVKVGWGQPFALAEQFNRRSTFIAAYRLAKDRNTGNPAEFARRAVLETQFVYTKANKPQWARGTIGGTLFTFKTYSVSYLELMQRMWTQGGPEGKRAVAWAMVMLMLMGGAGGLPFMEDAEDIIDGMGQMMGYNVSAKEWRKQAMADVLGQELAGFLEQGLSGLPGAPIDVSGRLGMGNLIPGTGLFLNKQSNTRDVVEMMGPAGDLVSRGFTAGKDVLAGVIGADLGRIGKGAMELAPNAVRNAAKGVDMMTSGMYKDTRGNKIIDTTLDEALWKMIGFQPGSVAQAQEGAQLQQRTRSFYTQTSNEIRQEWARAVFNKDERALERVRDRLSNWNEQNPELQIRINMADILKRVNNMKKDRAQRMADTAPRAMRQQMQEWAAQQR